MLFDKKKNTESVKIADSVTRKLIEKIDEEIKSVGISLEDAIYIHEVYKSSPQKKRS